MQHSYLPIVISFLNHVEKFFHDPTSQHTVVCEIYIFHFILLIILFLSLWQPPSPLRFSAGEGRAFEPFPARGNDGTEVTYI